MISADASFKANPAERPIEARAQSSLAGRSGYIAILSACLIHAGILSFLFIDESRQPVAEPEQTIPVEIVVEPPPEKEPPPSPPKPDPSPSANSIDEEPAFDAPRAANKEKIEREAPDEASKSPPAPTAADQPRAGGALEKSSAGPTREGDLRATQNAAEPEMQKPDAEVVKKAELNQDKTEEKQTRADAKAPLQPLPSLIGEPFPAWSGGQQMPTFEPAPDIELGSAATETPIDGGNAKSTYLTVLYGMVIAHLRLPPGIQADAAKVEGEINFSVDGRGNLTQHRIIRSSGSREFDAAALAAVAQAAPFPAPPHGTPLGLTFTFGAK
jgi:protein TonB